MQAPTDSLYKFISISCLIGLIFIYFDSHKRLGDLSAKVNESLIVAGELEATVDVFRDRRDYLERELANVSSEDSERKKRLQKYLDEHMSKMQEFKVALARLDKTNENHKKLTGEVSRTFESYNRLSLALLILLGVGLFFWYYKLQQYLDLKEKQSVKESVTPKPRLREKLPRRGK
ncbi:hypothetical protein QLG14_14455 [Pseudomonas sp. V104_10]|uniref:hypothetical protein n=1 Tax=Pseudomonas sp. V104_10 TaxID=3044231 RepID=UPI00249E9318|nr:hypothetical protein [Pseudomonas sp. V104_10]MDI3370436.1 hypothetical protein [Pseudomonas sp. V104_10]